MKRRQDSDGGEFFGKALPAEVALIERLARERELCAAIALGIWVVLLARAGRLPELRLEGIRAPSIKGLAAELGLDRCTVQKYVGLLEAGELVRLERPPGRKPTWWVAPGRPYSSDLPTRPAGVADNDGTPCRVERHPVPGSSAPAAAEIERYQREDREAAFPPRARGMRQVGAGVFQPVAREPRDYRLEHNLSKFKRQAAAMRAEAERAHQ